MNCFEETKVDGRQTNRLTELLILFAREFCHHEQIVEEKNFSLMRRKLFPFVDIENLVESTKANEPSVCRGQSRFLADESLFELKNLRNVIRVGTQFIETNSFVNRS